MFIKDRLFASLNLNEKEIELYDTVANLLEKNIIKPDLVIYLQGSTSSIMKKILIEADLYKRISRVIILTRSVKSILNTFFDIKKRR